MVKDGASSSSTQQVASTTSNLKSDSLFAKIEDGIKANPDKAKSVGAVFLYNITENGKTVKQWSKYLILSMYITLTNQDILFITFV